jgi:nitroreductase
MPQACLTLAQIYGTGSIAYPEKSICFAKKKKTMMTSIESIRQRRSVRTYTGEPLSKEHAERIEAYIAGLQAPFGHPASIRFVHGDTPAGRVKLGTYGFIDGACDYLALCCGTSPLSDESAGYVFEQLILYCTALGLGTCWLGGSFSRKDFGGRVPLDEGQRIRAVSPVGYAAGRKRLLEVVMGAERHHRSRKPFGSLFFYKDFDHALTQEAAGVYFQPLEMTRLAPSANNFQPWRVIVDANRAHFYHRKTVGGFDALDAGIALAHFGETCRELGLKGRFETLPDAPAAKEAIYSITWTGEPPLAAY